MDKIITLDTKKKIKEPTEKDIVLRQLELLKVMYEADQIDKIFALIKMKDSDTKPGATTIIYTDMTVGEARELWYYFEGNLEDFISN